MNHYFITYRFKGEVFRTHVLAPDEQCAKDSIIGEVLSCHVVEFDVAW